MSSISAPSSFKSGFLIQFNGIEADIPSGFQKCDGTNGTPDLRDSFVKGATAAGSTGGAASHSGTVDGRTLSTANLARHSHSISGKSALNYSTSGVILAFNGASNGTSRSGNTSSRGSNSSHNHTVTIPTEPVFYTCIYIMKL
jgi:microcystin-dependent protein